MKTCSECGKASDVLLIDCRHWHGTPEREKRYCPGCRLEYDVPGQRIFVVDRLASYPLEERIIDLSGPTLPGVY
jgi:hypothetical protein